jgi:hypothetical protein
MEGRFKMTFEKYLSDPCPNPSLSRSTIKDLISKTPRHAFWNHPKLNPDFKPEESEAKFDIGTAAHSIFLEGDNIAVKIDADDWRTTKAKEARDTARADGKVPLLAKQYDGVMAMVQQAHLALCKSDLSLAIDQGDSELTYIWQLADDTYCRCRPDWINKERTIILDYKTTSQLAHPEMFSRNITTYGYDIQDAFYKQGVHAIEETEPTFVFMVQEIEAPYLCAFIELDVQFQDMGEQKVKRGVQIWRECMKSGVWPSYANNIYTIEPPSYALASWEYTKLRGEANAVHV